MAVAFMRGTTTGPNDLNITVRNNLSQLIDPFRLEYAVYDYTTNVEVLMGSPVNIPVKMSTGQYYAPVMIPADSNVGDWRLRWTIQETAADPVYQSVQEFNVVGSNVITSVTGDPNLDRLLHSLRIMLRDANPDRNYSFRPPSKERFIQGQTQVFGFIWEDEELLEFLYMAVDDLNSRPPVTGITINDLWGGAQKWRTAIIMRAAAFACFAIAMNWIADEFSLGKDEKITIKIGEDGVEETLTIEDLFGIIYGERMMAYQDLARQGIEEVRHGKFIVFFKKLIRQIKLWPATHKNVRQRRIQGAFEREHLLIKSYVKEAKAVAWKPIKDVLKHNVEHKKIMNVLSTRRNGDIASIIVTEDHSLFNWNTLEPIKTSEVERNYKLIGLNRVVGEDSVFAYDVRTIQEIPYKGPVYDLSVPGTENFFTTSGLLAHNTYSISGVSLDIEKSSKYQSMKDEYIAEYDKLVEAAKRSVKIVKGLRMQKYGTGVMSALGPLSRPGVQSRRSMIESSRPVWS